MTLGIGYPNVGILPLRTMVSGALGTPTWDFDPATVVFDPGMAVRTGPGGVFAGSVPVQGALDGTGTGDVLSFPRGSQIAGSFYENFDMYQGDVVCWITPEWNPGDGTTRLLLDVSSVTYPRVNIYKLGTVLRFSVAISGVSNSVDVNISTWTPGTSYCVSCSWNTLNPIDGISNYLRVSINNAHTYGGTNSMSIGTPPYASIGIGNSAANPGTLYANASIEGLTISRRVLTDSNGYGTNVGNADELTAIYNAGAGQDPCLVTGSWDVVFALPTNATPGELTTTGQAWSHPHSGAELTDTFGETAYAASAWSDEGTPITPYSVEYNGTTTSTVVGDNALIQDLHDGAMEVGAWIRADGYGEGGQGAIITKGAATWFIETNIVFRLRVIIFCATTNAIATTSNFTPDGKWHYVSFTWDDAVDNYPTIFIDGIEQTPTTTQSRNGAVVSDIGNDLYFGNISAGTRTFDGAIGGVHICNAINHTSNFVPPSRLNPGAIPNRVDQWNFRDGAGGTLAATVTSPALDGTITNGTWNIVKDLDVDAPGQRIQNWGYVFGNDAANEGTTQQLGSLTAGQNYVQRTPIQYERDWQVWPRIQVYDDTNGAEITSFYGPRLVDVHTGANNSATLINSNGNFPQSLIGGTVYNITDGSSGTITAVSGDQTTITVTLAGGTDDDFDTNDVYMIQMDDEWVWCEPFCYELPTIARNGVVADCVTASWKVLNANTEGALYVHQVEVQVNLIDNPSLETGAGNPWIPDGWTNRFLDPGDTQASSTGGAVIHSGVEGIQYNVGSAVEGIYSEFTATQNCFYVLGGWTYGDGVAAFVLQDRYTRLVHQASNGNYTQITPIAANWHNNNAVCRATLTGLASIYISAASAAVGNRYADDFYAFEVDNVTLTVTPASEANSQEQDGIRNDGYDNCYDLIEGITAQSGLIRFSFYLRHDDPDWLKFGNATPVLAHAWGDATNYIYLEESAINTLQIRFNDGGGEHSTTWATGGTLAIDTKIPAWFEWSPAYMRLWIDGVIVATINQPVNFTTIPTRLYVGSNQAGTQQSDAVFAAP